MNISKVVFYGGAGYVTGANILLDTGSKKILFDCGLLQGLPEDREKNYKDFAYDPAEIDILFISHAHIDHIGLIPKLVAAGFTGRIISTAVTKEIARPMLDDALGHTLREAKKKQVAPLYQPQHIEKSFELWDTEDYYSSFSITKDISVEFLDAGHILGSVMVKLTRAGRVFVYTGDLGNSPSPLLRDTDKVEGAHYMVMESVYGNRNHEGREERENRLRTIFKDGIARGGPIIIASFSLERTQVLLYELNEMIENGEIPRVPVYLDSPLAIKITDIYKKHINLFNEEAKLDAKTDDLFDFPGFKLSPTRDDSKAINAHKGAKIILAGAGMSEGGRILHHEMHHLGNPNTTMVLAGYQAAGTFGRKLSEGVSPVKIMGNEIKVRARIEHITGFSSHKDRDQLVEFVSHSEDTLETVWCALGETVSAQFLAQRIQDYLGVKAVVPEGNESFDIQF